MGLKNQVGNDVMWRPLWLELWSDFFTKFKIYSGVNLWLYPIKGVYFN